MKKNIVLSFDDGRKDFYEYALPILKKYNLVATLNVTTGYVDGNFKPNWETSYGAASKEEIKEIMDNDIEIAYHGDMHITEYNDFNNSISKMKEWNFYKGEMGFAVPGSYLEEIDIEEFKKFLIANNIIYMRVGNSKKCLSFISRVFRKLYNVTNISIFYNLYNRNNTFDKQIDNYYLPSVVVFEKDNYKTLVNFIKKVKRKNIIFMLHGILPSNHSNYGKDVYAWDIDNFENLCKNLRALIDNNKIDVITNIELVRRNK